MNLMIQVAVHNTALFSATCILSVASNEERTWPLHPMGDWLHRLVANVLPPTAVTGKQDGTISDDAISDDASINTIAWNTNVCACVNITCNILWPLKCFLLS